MWQHHISHLIKLALNRHFGAIFAAKNHQTRSIFGPLMKQIRPLPEIGPKNRHFGAIFGSENRQNAQQNLYELILKN